MTPVYLSGLATAVPPHELPQTLVLETARRILGPRFAQFARMESSFDAAGVERRYSVAPLDWFEAEKSWPERNALYVEGAGALFVAAARGALDAAGWRADQIDTIVTVSSTGIATPTLEARVWREMGFRADVRRLPVFGLGCAGGVTGLEIARAQAAARPGSRVLLVAVECCTLSFRSDRLTKADIIATVLFGDGAAAACLGPEPGQGAAVALDPGFEQLWPDTLDIMGWEVEDAGLGVIFDRSIPSFVQEHFAGAVASALERAAIAPGALDGYVFHPGGAKVVTAIEAALDLASGTLNAERETLRDYGNMSAPTVLFVLERLIASGARGRMMLGALGPGFTASFLPLAVADHG